MTAPASAPVELLRKPAPADRPTTGTHRFCWMVDSDGWLSMIPASEIEALLLAESDRGHA